MDTEPGSAVVLITGVMAAGKSTVAGLPAGRLPRTAPVRGDVFRRTVVSGREELLPEETAEARAPLELRHRLSALVADEYARHGWTAVVQDVVLGEDLGRYVAEVRTRPLYGVVPAPSAAAVRSREAERLKTGYAAAWTVDALDRALRKETPRIGLRLDTSEQTPDQTGSAVLGSLPAARVRAGRPGSAAARPTEKTSVVRGRTHRSTRAEALARTVSGRSTACDENNGHGQS